MQGKGREVKGGMGCSGGWEGQSEGEAADRDGRGLWGQQAKMELCTSKPLFCFPTLSKS